MSALSALSWIRQSGSCQVVHQELEVSAHLGHSTLKLGAEQQTGSALAAPSPSACAKCRNSVVDGPHGTISWTYTVSPELYRTYF